MLRWFLVVACMLATLFPLGAQITNGTFQANSCSVPSGSYVFLGRGNPCISGWTIGDGTTDTGNGTIALVGTLWQAPAAGAMLSIDLDGESPGSISQTISTTPGATYSVTFALSGNPSGSSALKTLLVTAPGASTVYTYNTSSAGNTLYNMLYISEAFSFKASGTVSTLSFASEDASSSGGGPVIGNIGISVSLPFSPTSGITNGTFQANSCSVPSASYVFLGRGNPCILGWAIGDGTTDTGNGTIALVGGGYWQAPGGTSLSIDLDGESPGSISQTISTTPGATYSVTFALSGNPSGSSALKTLLVTAPGASTVYTYNTSSTGNTLSNMLYISEAFSFTASGTVSTLTFASEDVKSSGGGPVIGNIGITVRGSVAIPIVNAGFESDVLNCTPGPQCYDNFVIPGWTVSGASTFKPAAGPGGQFPGGIPGGSNVAALGGPAGPGVISQDLDLLRWPTQLTS